MTPAQLLARVPIKIETGKNVVYYLSGVYYTHVPELGDYWNYDVPDGADISSLQYHLFAEIYHDPRRSHRLAAVRFRGEWVMIITNAGLEGDDWHERFVLNQDKLWELIGTLQPIPKVDVVDINQDIPTMTSFYGESLF